MLQRVNVKGFNNFQIQGCIELPSPKGEEGERVREGKKKGRGKKGNGRRRESKVRGKSKGKGREREVKEIIERDGEGKMERMKGQGMGN